MYRVRQSDKCLNERPGCLSVMITRGLRTCDYTVVGIGTHFCINIDLRGSCGSTGCQSNHKYRKYRKYLLTYDEPLARICSRIQWQNEGKIYLMRIVATL